MRKCPCRPAIACKHWSGPGFSQVSASGTALLPEVKAIDPEGNVTTILAATELGPGQLFPLLTDITYHHGWLWIAHRQIGRNGWHVGAIARLHPDNPIDTFITVLTNLPASGDHHTNELIFRGEHVDFAQSTATNASVVGPDNFFVLDWLGAFRDFHDVPAQANPAWSGWTCVWPKPAPSCRLPAR